MKYVSKILGIALFLLTLPAFTQTPPIALIDHAPTSNGVPTRAMNCAAANFIAVATNFYGTPVAPTDSTGKNTYQMVGAPVANPGGYTGVVLWQVVGAAVSSAQTFAMPPGNTSMLDAMCSSGVAGLDQVSAVAGSATSGPITPTNPNELIITIVGGQQGTAANTIAAPFLLTDSTLTKDGGTAFQGFAQYVQTAIAPTTGTWTMASGIPSSITASFYAVSNPAPLKIGTALLPEAFAGVPYSFQLSVIGGVGPYNWIVDNPLPAGLTMSATGLISGIPTTAGTGSFRFNVGDSQGASATTQSLALTVASSPLAITTTSCPSGTQYQPYAGCSIAAKGGTAPYVFSWCGNPPYSGGSCNFTAQSLPDGLTEDPSSGSVAGTLLAMGPYNVLFTVTDAKGAVAAQSITFEIAGSNSTGTCSFPATSVWNLDVTNAPVDTSILGTIFSSYQSTVVQAGFGDITFGIPHIVVPASQPMVPVSASPDYFTAAPLPFNTPIEGTLASVTNPPLAVYRGDHHALVQQLGVGTGGGCVETDLYQVFPNYPDDGTHSWGDGVFGKGQYSAKWDMGTNDLPPADTGGADAAATPMAALGESASEVIGTGTPDKPNGTVGHVVRYTMNQTLDYHLWPATAQAGVGGASCTGGYVDQNFSGLLDPNNPPTMCSSTSTPGGFPNPMGLWLRLKPGPLPACFANAPQATIIAKGLQVHGMLQADNGRNGTITGDGDSRWNPADLACLSSLNFSQFDVINVRGYAVNWPLSAEVTTTSSVGTTPPPATAPVTPASATIVITASTAIETVSTLPVTVAINPAPVPPLVVSTTSLASGQVGALYSQQLAATGGVAPYIWSAPNLPPGLALSGSVVLGTPTTAGSFAVTATVTDSAGTTTPASFTITIAALPLKIAAPNLPPFTLSVPYSATVSASGGSGPITYSATGLPPGVKIDPSTGIISGVPTSQ